MGDVPRQPDEDSQMEECVEEGSEGPPLVSPEYVADVVTEQIRLLEIRLAEQMQEFAVKAREELVNFGESVQNFLNNDEESGVSSSQAFLVPEKSKDKDEEEEEGNKAYTECYEFLAEILNRCTAK